MKQSATCPKCQGRTIYVLQQDLIIAEAPGIGAEFVGRRAGELETHICASCGFGELYVNGMDRLRALARMPSSGVRVIDRPATAPYR